MRNLLLPAIVWMILSLLFAVPYGLVWIDVLRIEIIMYRILYRYAVVKNLFLMSKWGSSVFDEFVPFHDFHLYFLKMVVPKQFLKYPIDNSNFLILPIPMQYSRLSMFFHIEKWILYQCVSDQGK